MKIWQNPTLYVIMMAMKAGQKVAEHVADMNDWKKKMLISALVDIGDAAIGMGDIALPFDIPLVSVPGTLYDIFTLPIAVGLWGETGLLTAWEIFMPTEIGNAVDGFVPSVSLAGLLSKQHYMG